MPIAAASNLGLGGSNVLLRSSKSSAATNQGISRASARSLSRPPQTSSMSLRRRKEGFRILRAQSAAASEEDQEKGADGDEEEAVKSEEYSKEMQSKMGGGLAYVHEDGMNFNYLLPDLIVGSCPQSAADVERLIEEGVGTIFCLQEDHDSRFFGFEISDIQEACEKSKGAIAHVRCPVGDFDPFSLRLNLPRAVSLVHAAKEAAPGKSVYIHCTAGLGRAPGTALAYMHWMLGYDLMDAHSMLMEVRPCHPKLDAIRAATCDILFSAGRQTCRIAVSRFGNCSEIKVAGLDVGWSRLLDMEYNAATGRFELERDLLPGRYAYKFVWGDVWGYSADHPTFFDGTHTNNFLQVQSQGGPEEDEARRRLLSAQGTLTPEERSSIEEQLGSGALLGDEA